MRILLLIVLALSSCDTKSQATATLTAKELARQQLDAQDYEAAVESYKTVIEAEPEDYESYRFLAAAYAGAGGFDIFKAVKATLDSATGAASSNFLSILGSFVPSDPTEAQIDSLEAAGATILRLPEEYRSHDNPEIETSSSAAQQLEFYQTAFSLITINKFAKISEEGTIDISRLETITVEDVDAILGTFEMIVEQGSTMSEAAQDILSQIDEAPGGTRREKLIDYLNTHGRPTP